MSFKTSRRRRGRKEKRGRKSPEKVKEREERRAARRKKKALAKAKRLLRHIRHSPGLNDFGLTDDECTFSLDVKGCNCRSACKVE